ncbi:DUF2058 domain-containing protein [Parahaliea mediterranea]|uniref:DUF2058 domain-containing protein n=1 Tax=Parahaliea mediterranea TaxID=651086 RepID=A0A939DI69_9GAMM|nr:DUF2058 domain-containing protein [Parahaliea mediterranea]MBN7798580.1 DUF2058 domain-containing protein [Parahaliea mediterranea]
MSSLQDQLLKAGLIDGKKAKQADKEKRKQRRIAKSSGEQVEDATKVAVARARAEKAERDRALNAERDAAAQQKAIAAQIQQLVACNKQPKGNGDIAYNFVFERKIKKLYVTQTVHEHLATGKLMIVHSQGQFELVPRVIAEKIAERDPNAVIQPPQDSGPVDEDDPYADYQIPDDLMW